MIENRPRIETLQIMILKTMRKHSFLRDSVLATTFLSITFVSCSDLNKPVQASLQNEVDSLSYSLGYLYGKQFTPAGYTDFDYQNFVAGFQEGASGSDGMITEDDMMQSIQILQMKLEKMTTDQNQAKAEQNRAAAQAFLDENAKRPEVVITESGLQYEVLVEGTGVSPTAQDQVEVHYRGTLLDGRVFDSSYDRGQTATFPLANVIAGWTEGVQYMKEGAKFKFYIPADLGYGDNPRPGGIIEPGHLLIFEVELIDVK